AAAEGGPLEPEDLERLATAAYLTGRDEESAGLLERAHRAYLHRSDVERAARCAFWLAFGLLNRGEHARGGGWLARAHRLLDEARLPCAVQGLLLLPEGLRRLAEGDAEAAAGLFGRAAAIGERFGDPDLTVLARLGQGQAAIRRGEAAEGVALLDGVMVAVTAYGVYPVADGVAHCAVVEACQELFDLRRAQEWTGALSRWCASQPDLVPYRGQCLVRRAEVLQLQGDWRDALDEARRACAWLSPGGPAAGAAFYRQAELHRLRGAFAEAEAACRQASRCGRKPHPGLALLRLAEGRTAVAEAAI